MKAVARPIPAGPRVVTLAWHDLGTGTWVGDTMGAPHVVVRRATRAGVTYWTFIPQDGSQEFLRLYTSPGKARAGADKWWAAARKEGQS